MSLHKSKQQYHEEIIVDDNYELDEATSMLLAASEMISHWMKNTLVQRSRDHLLSLVDKLNDLAYELDFYNPALDTSDMDSEKSYDELDHKFRKVLSIEEKPLSD